MAKKKTIYPSWFRSGGPPVFDREKPREFLLSHMQTVQADVYVKIPEGAVEFRIDSVGYFQQDRSQEIMFFCKGERNPHYEEQMQIYEKELQLHKKRVERWSKLKEKWDQEEDKKKELALKKQYKELHAKFGKKKNE